MLAFAAKIRDQSSTGRKVALGETPESRVFSGIFVIGKPYIAGPACVNGRKYAVGDA